MFSTLLPAEQLITLTDDIQRLELRFDLPTLKQVHQSSPEDILHSIRFSPSLYPESLTPSPDTYWHRIQFQAKFDHAEPKSYMLHIGTHINRHLDLFLFEGERLLKQQSLGLLAQSRLDNTPGKKYQGPNFQFNIHSGQVLTLLIRKQNDGPAIAPITLYTSNEYQNFISQQSMLWGAAIAVLAALALYNAFVFALNPGKTYLWYLLFHSTTFIYFSALHGYGFLLWPSSFQVWLAQNIMPLNVLLVWIFIQFAREFLNTPVTCPRWHQYISWFNIVTPPALIAAYLLPEYLTIPVFSVYQFMVSVFAVMLSVSAIKSGFRPARYFLVSWCFVMIGAAIGMATYINQLPTNLFTLHGFFIGSICELLFLSVALADRLRYAEKKAISKAYVDPQKKLPNYSFFINEFSKILYQKQQSNTSVALVILDTLNYQHLVGFLGPNILEPVYRSHISRLRAYLQNQDWAIAFEQPSGKQDFFIMLPGERLLVLIKDEQQLEARLQSLWEHCSQPLKIQDFEVTLDMHLAASKVRSIGTQSILDDYRNLQVALLNCEQENQPWVIYSEEQSTALKDHLSLLGDLKQAINDKKIAVEVQPQFDLYTQELTGGEILVRWSHSSRGNVDTETFITLAEQTGLITKITEHIIEYVFQWLSLQKHIPGNFTLAINLSVHDLMNESFIQFIEQQQQTYQVNSHQITFEITESSMMDNASRALKIIQQLQSMGYSIAIDDFGTGYSSLSYLQQIKADKIKVDLSFVRGIQQSKTNQAIVNTIIQLAHTINAKTIAEGIESADELLYLKNLNCHQGQGTFWSHPLSPERFSQRFFK